MTSSSVPSSALPSSAPPPAPALEELEPSPSQRAAIEAPVGPVLVLAGPGAGKTFCLIERIRWLIEHQRVDPARICALTFTNKAAEEIALRLKKELGDRASLINRSTIHSLCVAILREHGSVLGLERGFGIADEEYQKEVLSWLLVKPERRTGLLSRFSLHRLLGTPLVEAEARKFAHYRRHLEKRGMVDFDDLLLRSSQLLAEHDDVARAVAGRWDHILVDEFQDLNHVQYGIVKRLGWDHGNVFAVGDDDQSIFSWTGADPRLITRFANDFGIRSQIVLKDNRRSARQIFELARKLIALNHSLFTKTLEATHESHFPVEARSFDTEREEEEWLVGDLRRAAAAWGQVAILYRKHEVGEGLEGRLMREGIPCRLAQGRAVVDDQVIRYLIAALRMIIAPGDPVHAELFAKRVLPTNLCDRLQSEARRSKIGYLQAMRRMGRSLPNMDEDGRKIRRALATINNFAALVQRHETLSGLVEELLSQRVGTYRTLLEQRADELSDPALYPAVTRLTESLRAVRAEHRRVLVPIMGGREIGLAGMFSGAGFAHVDYLTPSLARQPDDFVLEPGAGGDLGLVLGTFKALQLLHAESQTNFADCVVFDLETTGLDREKSEIVEIAAARVRNWEVVAEFRTLVNPRVPIEAKAQETHGYSAIDLATAPRFEEVWPRFREFVGADPLVAHNGNQFDFPLLGRMAREVGDDFGFLFFDTLPLARWLFPKSAKLVHLAQRFGIDPGRSHQAHWDVRTLAQVFRRLEEEKVARARRVALSNLLDYLSVGLALSDTELMHPEAKLLREATRIYPLGRYSQALDFYRIERARIGPSAASTEELIERLGGVELMARVRAERRPDQRYPNAMARIRRLMDGISGETIYDQIGELLARLALSRSDGVEADPDRVNLLTLHATKGLEFSRVYLVGVEDGQMIAAVGGKDVGDPEIEEARRLVYVGMTRAKDRLVMTRVGLRRGRPTGGHRFLDEMGLTPTST